MSCCTKKWSINHSEAIEIEKVDIFFCGSYVLKAPFECIQPHPLLVPWTACLNLVEGALSYLSLWSFLLWYSGQLFFFFFCLSPFGFSGSRGKGVSSSGWVGCESAEAEVSQGTGQVGGMAFISYSFHPGSRPSVTSSLACTLFLPCIPSSRNSSGSSGVTDWHQTN